MVITVKSSIRGSRYDTATEKESDVDIYTLTPLSQSITVGLDFLRWFPSELCAKQPELCTQEFVFGDHTKQSLLVADLRGKDSEEKGETIGSSTRGPRFVAEIAEPSGMANTSASALGLFLLLTEQKGRVGERGLCSVTLSSTVPDRARIAVRLTAPEESGPMARSKARSDALRAQLRICLGSSRIFHLALTAAPIFPLRRRNLEPRWSFGFVSGGLLLAVTVPEGRRQYRILFCVLCHAIQAICSLLAWCHTAAISPVCPEYSAQQLALLLWAHKNPHKQDRL
ncbi:hypothetical protein QQF64_006008 [Cirrhinus molitorella]|uniref:Uncharacterized protein n=1 Tax=Cirrhinus molitorella TaxID=172907 RepID=A0ABR3MDS9_9TELE